MSITVRKCDTCLAEGTACDPRCPERVVRQARMEAWDALTPPGHKVMCNRGHVVCECGEVFGRMDLHSGHIIDLRKANLRNLAPA